MKRLFMTFLEIAILLGLCRGHEVHGQPLPADFKLSASVGGNAPWEEKATVTVDNAGHVRYVKFTTGHAFGVIEEKGDTLSASDVLPVWQMIQDSSFFALQSFWSDTTIEDGIFAKVVVTANGSTHQVVIKNISQPRLEAIIKSLNSILPQEMRLDYEVIDFVDLFPQSRLNQSSTIIQRGLQREARIKGSKDLKGSGASRQRTLPSSDDNTTHPGTVVAYDVSLDDAVAGGYATLKSKGEYYGDGVSVSVDNRQSHAAGTITITLYLEFWGPDANAENVGKIETDILNKWSGLTTTSGQTVNMNIVDWIDASASTSSNLPGYNQVRLVPQGSVRSSVDVPPGTGVNSGTVDCEWGSDEPAGIYGHEAGHVMGLPDRYDDYDKQADGSWVNSRTGQSYTNDEMEDLVASEQPELSAETVSDFLQKTDLVGIPRDGSEHDLMADESQPYLQSDLDQITANPGLLVNVPYGSMFLNKDNSRQNLVTTHADQVFVKPGESRTVNGIYIACVDHHKSIPEYATLFDLIPPLGKWRGIAAAGPLAKFVHYMDSTGLYDGANSIAQYAIWRMSDNTLSIYEDQVDAMLLAAGVSLGNQVLDFPRLTPVVSADTTTRQVIPDGLFAAELHPRVVGGHVGVQSTCGATLSVPSGVAGTAALIWSATGPDGAPAAISATDSTVSLTPSRSGVYQLNLKISVTDTARVQRSFDSGKEAFVIVPDNFTETFEHTSLTDAFAWKTYGDVLWKITGTGAETGLHAAQPDEIGAYQTATLEVDLKLPADSVIVFSVRTATVDNYDRLVFSMDSSEVDSFSGLSDWKVMKYPLSKGAHVLTWTCSGDAFTPVNQVWLDNVFFPGDVVATGVKTAEPLPTAYALKQNYPNPFNPSTTIPYELPRASHVKLTVYDMLGREVSTLVNELKQAGRYEAVFDGRNHSSGVYFYRVEVRPLDSAMGRDSKSGAGSPSLRSGQGFVQTRKLVLLR